MKRLSCCQSSCNDDITIKKFKNFSTIIKYHKIPYTIDCNSIMICSPVGNQNKFLNSNPQIQADIVLSGYCTAPDALKSYISDICIGVEDAELKNSFNTQTMRSGIETLLESLGLKNHIKIYNTALSSYLDPDFNILLTQMLCMISFNGTPEANNVEIILTLSNGIREQAQHSLKGWYDRITTILKPGGVILLMGKNAKKLIKNSYFNNNAIKIDLCNSSKKKHSLYNCLKKCGFQIFFVPHAAAINRNKQYKTKWEKNEKRKDINTCLY